MKKKLKEKKCICGYAGKFNKKDKYIECPNCRRLEPTEPVRHYYIDGCG
jgi:hypothetical protein